MTVDVWDEPAMKPEEHMDRGCPRGDVIWTTVLR